MFVIKKVFLPLQCETKKKKSPVKKIQHMENISTINFYLRKAALYNMIKGANKKQLAQAIEGLIACSDENTIKFLENYLNICKK